MKRKNKTQPTQGQDAKAKFLAELDSKELDKATGGWTPCQCGSGDDQGTDPWNNSSSSGGGWGCAACGGGWW